MKTTYTPRPTKGSACADTRLFLSFLLIAMAIVFSGSEIRAATLPSQWRYLPEVQVKPEASAIGLPPPVKGGNEWKKAVQTPDLVPVKLSGLFKADDCTVTFTLAGVSVAESDPNPASAEEHPFVETATTNVNLKPYQTYELRMYGDSVYHSEAILEPPSLNDLFSSPTMAQQPARVYKMYIWNTNTMAWEKLCTQNAPEWGVDSWDPMDVKFLVQVRPDLGARPVTRPGMRGANGEDQGDDAWTRDEPAIDANTAPGDGDIVEMASARMGDPASVRFSWSAYMGRLWSGAGAGKIRLSEFGFTTNTYTPRVLNYAARSSDTNEIAVIMDLDDTNWLTQIKAPQALADIELIYGSALFTTNDLIGVSNLVVILTNHSTLLSQCLWTNFSTNAQQVLLSTNSSQAQLQNTILTNFNQIIQGASLYESNRFAGITLIGRTKRLLLRNPPSGQSLIRLNRFLLEDAYTAEIGRIISTSFNVNFYVSSVVGSLDSLGFFTVASNTTPFVTWRMGLPDGTTNQWRLQEIRNSVTNTTLLAYGTNAGLWTLTRGAGNEARVETRTITTNTTGGVTRAVETQEIKNGAGTVSDRTVEVFQSFAWGYELVAVTNDPGGANLVTQFSFHSDTNDLATHGKIESIVYPDGFWERREYSHYDLTNNYAEYLKAPFGALIRAIQPWKNTAIDADANDCLVTDYSYDVYVPGTYRVQRWHDAEYFGQSSTYSPWFNHNASTVFEEETELWVDPCAAQSLGAQVRQLGNLQHYGEYHSASTFDEYYGRLAGQLSSKWDYPGSLDSYDYEFGSWNPTNLTFTVGQSATNDVRQTIYHGQIGISWLLTGQYDYYPYDTISYGSSGAAIDPVNMELNRATMEVRVIHEGNLAAKEMYVYQGDFTNFALIERVIYQRDCLGHATNVFQVDPSTQQQRVIYKADWRGSGTWPTDLKLNETDESGTILTNTFDSLKRPTTKTKVPATGQSAIVTTLSYDAAGRVLTNAVAAGSLSQTTVLRYDAASRLTNQISPQGLVTSYTYANGGRQTTITGSAGTTQTISKYLDRRVASISGNAVTNQFLDYGLTSIDFDDALYPKNMTTNRLGSTNSLRWTATITDLRNEAAAEWKPAFGVTNVLYKDFSGNYFGQPGAILESDMDGNSYGYGFRTDLRYDGKGAKYAEFRDDRDEGVYLHGLASMDRGTTYTSFFVQLSGDWFHVSEQWAYPYDYVATPQLVERTKERLTGFASNQISETLKFDADTNQTTVKVFVDLANKKLTTTTTVPQSSLTATQIVVNGLLQTESTPTVAPVTTHYYDALGREIGVTDPLGNRSGTRYDTATGQVTATTNALGLATTMEYYAAGGTNAGLLKCTTTPTGKKTYYNYNGRGQVTHIWGDVPYPEKREYDDYGVQITLTTYRGGSQWTGSSWPSDTGATADATHWYYDEPTGLLTNKTDAAGQAVKFDYYVNGFPKSRVWARGVASTNLYTLNGDLARINYSDGNSVVFTNAAYTNYDRMARPRMVSDASGTNVFTYDHAARLVATTCTDGLLGGVTVTNHFDPVRGRDGLRVLGLSSGITNNYAYDTYGRLVVVSNGVYSSTYGYLPNSDLLQTTTSKSNATTVLTTTRSWEYGVRLSAIVNEVNGVNISSHSYTYDALSRRTRAALEDGSYWQYDYNDRNELTGARRYWPDMSPISGQHFGYDYDNIGNRETASSGGDISGTGLRPVSYAANNLNQYTGIATPGYEHILGVALATNSVTVNGGTADRKGEYFHREIPVGNGGGPLWTNVTVSSGGTTNTGGLVVPDDNQTLTYDADGNLTFDGVWTYNWDAENRLKAMTMTNVTSIANSNRLRLEFVYDYQGRRVQKIVSTNSSGSTFVAQSTNRFAYDGWNLLAILNPQSSILKSFTWGQDLSGTMDQAGGIGGLLLVTCHGSSNTNCFLAYDGNGNVTALARSGSDPVVARYEYSAYGELLRANGPLATANPFRWSTKFWDQESGLIYYGVRYFSSVSGRWISRDPIAEEGGINLYAFIHNNAINGLDAIGKLTTFEQEVMADVYADEAQAAKFIAQRGETIITRVQQAANAHAQGQSLSVTIMDSAEGDATELLNLFTRINNEGFGAALRGSRTVRAVGEEWHHIFPRAQEFARYFKEANINIERFQIGLQRMYHQGRALSLHARGFGGRGGLWNAAWRDFFGRDGFRALAGNQAAQEEAILKFGSQMFQFFVGI